MTKYMITRADGGVSIMQLLDDKATPESEIAKWPEALRLSVVSVEPINIEAIPSDRTFRDAWCKAGGGIGVSMNKARQVHMGRIREVRDRELAKLDVEQLKGRDVQAQKQKLRDIPQTFDLTTAATPDELKALWPTELPR